MAMEGDGGPSKWNPPPVRTRGRRQALDEGDGGDSKWKPGKLSWDITARRYEQSVRILCHTEFECWSILWGGTEKCETPSELSLLILYNALATRSWGSWMRATKSPPLKDAEMQSVQDWAKLQQRHWGTRVSLQKEALKKMNTWAGELTDDSQCIVFLHVHNRGIEWSIAPNVLSESLLISARIGTSNSLRNSV